MSSLLRWWQFVLGSSSLIAAGCGTDSSPVPLAERCALPFHRGGAPSCAPGTPPQAKSLCGPEPDPCHILAEDVVGDTCSATRSRKSLEAFAVDAACAPHLVLSVVDGPRAEDRFHGHATRGSHGWKVGPTHVTNSPGDYRFAPDGTGYLLASDAEETNPPIQLWQELGDSFIELDTSPLSGFGAATQIDPQGSLHAISAHSRNLEYASFSAATGWSDATSIDVRGGQRPVLAYAADGTEHAAWGRFPLKGDGIVWATLPPVAPETVFSDPVDDGLLAPLSLVVTPSGAPHILFLHTLPFDSRQPNSQISSLSLATRAADGTWSIVEVDRERANPAVCQCSDGACFFDFEKLVPFGLLASASGDVRVVYSKVHHLGETFFPPVGGDGGCIPELVADGVGSPVTVAWLDTAGVVRRQDVGEPGLFTSGTARLDANGTIHVALVETRDVQATTTTRYLAVGR